MRKKLKIGIVGCGAIGSSLAKAVKKDFCSRAEISALFDLESKRAQALSRSLCGARGIVAKDLAHLIAKSDLVIEAASAKSSWEIAQRVLMKRRDIMIMSVGGIAAHGKKLSALAEKCNARVYIPSGAIAGIDALKSASAGKVKSVTLTTTKNPKAFEGVEYVRKMGVNLSKIKEDIILFSGSAEQAVRCFPQNINVAGILSIAGIGQAKTKVRIVASPKTTKNIHEVRIDSEAATIVTRAENVLHPENPKTSFLAVLSAIATLRQILEPIKVGT